jgi:hypothetical protein
VSANPAVNAPNKAGKKVETTLHKQKPTTEQETQVCCSLH